MSQMKLEGIKRLSEISQTQNINIASLYCDRNSKGGTASMCIALDMEVEKNIIEIISKIEDVYFVTCIRKLEL